ncbi:hypothetical protein M9H77_02683 [Catharanthus roseus]|uniref:Uncharacterized protein n=1 Tax=Catharanthus roseus TaxID=4058 RepID=A0ACC0C929_CATRO|nr:hypothetical protein M9H77_02683 [Catharanthus roseus]
MRQIAYGAYGPYFTGVVQKAWTLLTNRMISHAQLVRKILKYRDMDPNLRSVRMTMMVHSFTEKHHYFNYTHTVLNPKMAEHEIAITQMVSNELSMLYTTVTDDDAEIGDSDEEYVASSQSE